MKNREYQAFASIQPVAPPAALTESVLSRVARELNPGAWRIFSKLALIHFFVGAGTLAICPQFGIRLFGDGLGIMKYFWALGHYGCSAACGGLFVGTTLFIAGLLLKPDEIRVLRKGEWLQIAAIGLLSLGGFIVAEAEVLLAFGLAWLVGSVLGGAVMLEISWRFRARLGWVRR